VLTEVRKKGCRILIIDGKPVDISAEVELDESKVKDMDAVVDRFVVGRKHEKAIKAGIAATLLVGDGLLQVHIVKGAGKAEAERFLPVRSPARRITSSTAIYSPNTSCSTTRRAPAGLAAAWACTSSPTRSCSFPIRAAAF